MVKTKTLVEQNNERRKLLNEENTVYYENLLVYIRTSFLKDERATEEVLMELLEHLLSAQQDGKTAEEVFGKEPKELADDIIMGLPNEKPSKTVTFIMELVLQFLGMFTAITGLAAVWKDEPKTIHLGSASLLIAYQAIGILIFIAVLLKLLKSDVFKQNPKSKKMYWLVGVASGIFMGGILVLTLWMEPFGSAVEVSKYTQLGMGLVLVLTAYGLQKWREAK